MEQALEILKAAFGESLGPALGAALALGALALIAVMLAVPVWLSMKRRAGLSAEQRTAIVRELDAADRVVTSVYEYLIYAAIAAMTGLAMFLYLVLPDDGNRDFLIFYGGVLYLLGMLWAAGQLWSVHRRRRRAADPGGELFGLPQLRSKFSFDFQVAEPQTFTLDDAALERAAARIAAGGTIDEACALVIPQYEQLNGIVKGVLRQGVQAALEARQK